MIQHADIAIIGAGVNGLGTAYHLASRGAENMVVLERGYIGVGATGRCGAGIRQQWGLEENIVLARESVKLFERLSAELRFNVMFRQGGYLVLIYDQPEHDRISNTIPLQNRLGVPSRLLSVQETRELAPGLNTDGLLAGAYCPTDGVCYPYAVLWGYAEAARKRGVDIRVHTTVTGLSRLDDGRYEIATDRGAIRAPVVVNVAGARSRDIASMIGISLPTQPVRHEIAVTESLKPFLEPMVISTRKDFYFSQSIRGEVIGGVGDPQEPPSYSRASSPDFLFRFAKTLREVFPALGRARIVRQWAGLYDVSPDARPIMGKVDGYPGYYHACGFTGHGFMLSPIVTKLLAELIVTGRTSIPIDSLGLDRFEKGPLQKDPYVVG